MKEDKLLFVYKEGRWAVSGSSLRNQMLEIAFSSTSWAWILTWLKRC